MTSAERPLGGAPSLAPSVFHGSSVAGQSFQQTDQLMNRMASVKSFGSQASIAPSIVGTTAESSGVMDGANSKQRRDQQDVIIDPYDLDSSDSDIQPSDSEGLIRSRDMGVQSQRREIGFSVVGFDMNMSPRSGSGPTESLALTEQRSRGTGSLGLPSRSVRHPAWDLSNMRPLQSTRSRIGGTAVTRSLSRVVSRAGSTVAGGGPSRSLSRNVSRSVASRSTSVVGRSLSQGPSRPGTAGMATAHGSPNATPPTAQSTGATSGKVASMWSAVTGGMGRSHPSLSQPGRAMFFSKVPHTGAAAIAAAYRIRSSLRTRDSNPIGEGNSGGDPGRPVSPSGETVYSRFTAVTAVGSELTADRTKGRQLRRRLLKRRGWDFELQPAEVDYHLGRTLPLALTRPQPTLNSEDEESSDGESEAGEEEEGSLDAAARRRPEGHTLEGIKSYAHELAPDLLWWERMRAAKRAARATGKSVTVKGRMDKKRRRELLRKIQKWDNREWFSLHKRTPPAPPLHPAVARVIEQWFALVDDDGSGTLDHSELLAALRASKVPVSADNINEMITLMDMDGDGVINWKEFETFFMYEFAAGKNLLSGEYVLPSGVALPFGAMIAKLKREKLIGDLLKGGEPRTKWMSVADNPIALEDELGTMAAVEMAIEEMRNPALGRRRALAAKALNRLPPHLRTKSMVRHLERHPEITEKLLRAPSLSPLLMTTMKRVASTSSAVMKRLASQGSQSSANSTANGGVPASASMSTGGNGGSGSGTNTGRMGNVDLNVAAALAAGLEWPVSGANFFNKRARTVLRAACQRPAEILLKNQSVASGRNLTLISSTPRDAKPSGEIGQLGAAAASGSDKAATPAAADGGGADASIQGSGSQIAAVPAAAPLSRVPLSSKNSSRKLLLSQSQRKSSTSIQRGRSRRRLANDDDEDSAGSGRDSDSSEELLPWLVNAKRRADEEKKTLMERLGVGSGRARRPSSGSSDDDDEETSSSSSSDDDGGGETGESDASVSPMLKVWLKQQGRLNRHRRQNLLTTPPKRTAAQLAAEDAEAGKDDADRKEEAAEGSDDEDGEVLRRPFRRMNLRTPPGSGGGRKSSQAGEEGLVGGSDGKGGDSSDVAGTESEEPTVLLRAVPAPPGRKLSTGLIRTSALKSTEGQDSLTKSEPAASSGGGCSTRTTSPSSFPGAAPEVPPLRLGVSSAPRETSDSTGSAPGVGGYPESTAATPSSAPALDVAPSPRMVPGTQAEGQASTATAVGGDGKPRRPRRRMRFEDEEETGVEAAEAEAAAGADTAGPAGATGVADGAATADGSRSSGDQEEGPVADTPRTIRSVLRTSYMGNANNTTTLASSEVALVGSASPFTTTGTADEFVRTPNRSPFGFQVAGSQVGRWSSAGASGPSEATPLTPVDQHGTRQARQCSGGSFAGGVPGNVLRTNRQGTDVSVGATGSVAGAPALLQQLPTVRSGITATSGITSASSEEDEPLTPFQRRSYRPFGPDDTNTTLYDIEALDADEARELMAAMTLEVSRVETAHDVHTGHNLNRPNTSQFRAALAKTRAKAASVLALHSLPPHPDYSGVPMAAVVHPSTATAGHSTRCPSPPVQSVLLPSALTLSSSGAVATAPSVPVSRSPSSLAGQGGAAGVASDIARKGRRRSTKWSMSTRPNQLLSVYGVQVLGNAEGLLAVGSQAPVRQPLADNRSSNSLVMPEPTAHSRPMRGTSQSYGGCMGGGTGSGSGSFSGGMWTPVMDCRRTDSGMFADASYSSFTVTALPAPPLPPACSGSPLGGLSRPPDAGVLAAALATARNAPRSISQCRSPVHSTAASSRPVSRIGSPLRSPSEGGRTSPTLSGGRLLRRPMSAAAASSAAAAALPVASVTTTAAQEMMHDAAVVRARCGSSIVTAPEAWEAHVAAMMQRHMSSELAALRNRSVVQSPRDGSPARSSSPSVSSRREMRSRTGTGSGGPMELAAGVAGAARLAAGGGAGEVGGGRRMTQEGAVINGSSEKPSRGFRSVSAAAATSLLGPVGCALPDFVPIAGVVPIRIQSRYAMKRPGYAADNVAASNVAANVTETTEDGVAGRNSTSASTEKIPTPQTLVEAKQGLPENAQHADGVEVNAAVPAETSSASGDKLYGGADATTDTISHKTVAQSEGAEGLTSDIVIVPWVDGAQVKGTYESIPSQKGAAEGDEVPEGSGGDHADNVSGAVLANVAALASGDISSSLPAADGHVADGLNVADSRRREDEMDESSLADVDAGAVGPAGGDHGDVVLAEATESTACVIGQKGSEASKAPSGSPVSSALGSVLASFSTLVIDCTSDLAIAAGAPPVVPGDIPMPTPVPVMATTDSSRLMNQSFNDGSQLGLAGALHINPPQPVTSPSRGAPSPKSNLVSTDPAILSHVEAGRDIRFVALPSKPIDLSMGLSAALSPPGAAARRSVAPSAPLAVADVASVGDSAAVLTPLAVTVAEAPSSSSLSSSEVINASVGAEIFISITPEGPLEGQPQVPVLDTLIGNGLVGAALISSDYHSARNYLASAGDTDSLAPSRAATSDTDYRFSLGGTPLGGEAGGAADGCRELWPRARGLATVMSEDEEPDGEFYERRDVNESAFAVASGRLDTTEGAGDPSQRHDVSERPESSEGPLEALVRHDGSQEAAPTTAAAASSARMGAVGAGTMTSGTMVAGPVQQHEVSDSQFDKPETPALARLERAAPRRSVAAAPSRLAQTAGGTAAAASTAGVALAPSTSNGSGGSGSGNGAVSGNGVSLPAASRLNLVLPSAPLSGAVHPPHSHRPVPPPPVLPGARFVPAVMVGASSPAGDLTGVVALGRAVGGGGPGTDAGTSGSLGAAVQSPSLSQLSSTDLLAVPQNGGAPRRRHATATAIAAAAPSGRSRSSRPVLSLSPRADGSDTGDSASGASQRESATNLTTAGRPSSPSPPAASSSPAAPTAPVGAQPASAMLRNSLTGRVLAATVNHQIHSFPAYHVMPLAQQLAMHGNTGGHGAGFSGLGMNSVSGGYGGGGGSASAGVSAGYGGGAAVPSRMFANFNAGLGVPPPSLVLPPLLLRDAMGSPNAGASRTSPRTYHGELSYTDGEASSPGGAGGGYSHSPTAHHGLRRPPPRRRGSSTSESLPLLPSRTLSHEGPMPPLPPLRAYSGGSAVSAPGGPGVAAGANSGSNPWHSRNVLVRALGGGTLSSNGNTNHQGNIQQHPPVGSGGGGNLCGSAHARKAAWAVDHSTSDGISPYPSGAISAAVFAPAAPQAAPLFSPPLATSLSELPDIVTLLSEPRPHPLRSVPTRVRKMDY